MTASPGWEELGIEACGVEPSHRPCGQADCADGDDEVGGLHPCAAGADLVPQPWVCFESVPHPGAEGKQAGNLVVEGAVNGQDGVDRRLGRLTDAPGLQVRTQPRLSVWSSDVNDPHGQGA